MAVLIGTAAALGAKALLGGAAKGAAAKAGGGFLKKALGKSVGGASMNPLGAGLAAGQMISGLINRKKADAQIPGENAEERQLVSSLASKSRQLATGTANNADRVAARQMAKTMAGSAFKTGGKANMGVASSAISQALGNINAQNREMASAYDDKLAKATEDITGKELEKGMLRSGRTSALAENQVSAGQDNLLASVGVVGKKKEEEEENTFAKLSSLLKKKK